MRRAYLSRAARLVEGPTLDFGCGVGELLRRPPAGSAGVEYNRSTVEFCQALGLPVQWYDGSADEWTPSGVFPGSEFRSMVLSHVLEHLDDPGDVLVKLLRAGATRGITRVLVIVPGPAGFRIDPTHRTFVDLEMLADRRLFENTGFKLYSSAYFPLNSRGPGNWFPYHELQVVYQRG